MISNLSKRLINDTEKDIFNWSEELFKERYRKDYITKA
jgi:hypothetical protein